MMQDEPPYCVPEGYYAAHLIVRPEPEHYRLLCYEDGTVVRFAHVCDRGPRGVIICAPALQLEMENGHTLTFDDQGLPTVSPSILCADCGAHGWIRAGVWTNA